MRTHLAMPLLLPCEPTSFGPWAKDDGHRAKQHAGLESPTLAQPSCGNAFLSGSTA